MKRKSPKPKTPKTPRTPVVAPPGVTSVFSHDSIQPPSVEWLADAAMRVLVNDKFPLIQAGAAGAEGIEESDEIYTKLSYATFAAWRFHEAAVGFFKLQRAMQTSEAAVFLSPEEIASNRVEFARGCQLITGEEKRSRAIEKYAAFVIATGLVPLVDGEPILQPDKDSGHLPSSILTLMAAYEHFSKKPIDLVKSQYAPHPGHNAKPKRQRRKKRGAKYF